MEKSLYENGERVLNYIEKNPGCYLRQIGKELGLSMGSVQYHASQLQKRGKISSTR